MTFQELHETLHRFQNNAHAFYHQHEVEIYVGFFIIAMTFLLIGELIEKVTGKTK